MNTEEFEGLNVGDYTTKLENVSSLELLTQLETIENKKERPRTTVLAGIENKRQSLVEEGYVEKKDEVVEAKKTTEDGAAAPKTDTKTPPEPKPVDFSLEKQEEKNEEATETKEGLVPPAKEVPLKETEEKNEKLEEIQDMFLDEMAVEVQKIESLEELEELRKIEYRDDHRKGADALIDKRISELKEAEVLNLDVNTDSVSPTDTQEAKKDIKKMRVRLDYLGKCAKQHMRIDSTALSGTLFMAKAWLGILLKELGSDNPYANEDKIKNASEIPATADAFEQGPEEKGLIMNFGLKNVLPAVIEIREELEKLATDLEKIEFSGVTKEANIARTQSWIEVRRSKFLLRELMSTLRN